MRRSFFVLALLVGFRSAAPAQPVVGTPETAPLVVMNLAAHPDDEDGSTLAYYRHARNAIAYSVIYTRGEGGQNEIGPELYEELGAIRTDETERAARHLGTQVYFLNFKDFGFSKSAEETFDVWGGRDEVTARIVYLIRKLKPDVLFTNHDTVTVGPGRQHGHHQAVGISAFDAFGLASDPSYHPEQLDEEGVDLWQPKRMFHRLWTSRGEHDVAVPVGDVDQSTGRSYAQMAGAALHEHASQGMELFSSRIGEWKHTHFVLYRSTTDAPLSPTDLAGNLPPNETARPDVTYWIASGRLPSLPAESVSVSDSIIVPGAAVRVSWQPQVMPDRPFRIRFFGAVDTSIVIRDDSPAYAHLKSRKDAAPTIPKKVFQYNRFRNHSPLGYAIYDVRGSRLITGGFLNIEVAPPLYLEAGADVVRLTKGANEIPYTLRIYDSAIERVIVSTAVSSDGDRRVLDQRQEELDSRESVRRNASVLLPSDLQPGAYTISLAAMGVGSGQTATDFVGGRVFEVKIPAGLRVGVVESYDNTLDRALSELGVYHAMLDSADLASGDLDRFHTIVIDIRAYLVRSDLKRHNDRLLNWVRRGGHLIVNYHKTFEWNTATPDPFDPARRNSQSFAPYPLELGRERVTREDAPVRLLEPEHPLFHHPNTIMPGDWLGWVQERGLYFPSSYDERYLELLSLSDPGEQPLRGSTLLARFGEGTYLYTALVWYRQLKEHHAGAYKMFANMISLPLVDERRPGP